MNLVDTPDGMLCVSLSRRNLTGLLAQVEEVGFGQIMRTCKGTRVIVVAEHDEKHYHSSQRDESVRGSAGSSDSSQTYGEPIPDEWRACGNCPCGGRCG